MSTMPEEWRQKLRYKIMQIVLRNASHWDDCRLSPRAIYDIQLQVDSLLASM